MFEEVFKSGIKGGGLLRSQKSFRIQKVFGAQKLAVRRAAQGDKTAHDARPSRRRTRISAGTRIASPIT